MSVTHDECAIDFTMLGRNILLWTYHNPKP